MNSIIYGEKEYRVFDRLYAVAFDGSVLRYMLPFYDFRTKNGYIFVGKYRLHRMVAACWLIGFTGPSHVHHINGDTADNRAENLILTTNKEHTVKYHPEKLQKMHNAARGRVKTSEERAAISNRLTGRKVSASTREKLRNLRTGSKTSEETKQKQREASLRLGSRPPSWLGRKKTPEQAMKTTITLYKPCSVDGVVYPSFKHAAAALGIKPGTLRRRLFSKNFHNYILL